MEKNIYLGVDIGGTAIKMAVITPAGKILHQWQDPTNISDGGSHIADQIAQSAKEQVAKAGLDWALVKGVGVGAPGPVNDQTGVIEVAVNLGWRQYPLRDELAKRLDRPVYLINDANAAGLGELWMGAGQGYHSLLFVTLGTGIGCGVVIEGKIVNGAHSAGGEIGHISVQGSHQFLCGCGKTGCIETIASAGGFVRVAAKHYAENAPSTAKELFERAGAGEEKAKEVVEEVLEALAYVLAAVAITIDPEVIIVGGGVSKAGDALIEPIYRRMQPYLFPPQKGRIPLRIATLENDAGVLGAVYHAIHEGKDSL